MKKLLAVLVTAVLLVVGTMVLRWPEAPTADMSPETGRLLALLGAIEPTDEKVAGPPRPGPPVFPADHGAHLSHAMETWRFAGRTATREGHPFGFRLDLYRVRLLPADAPPRESAWATRHVYWAQLSITDVRKRSFKFFERYSRDGPSLAGVERWPPRIAVEGWRVAFAQGSTAQSQIRLQAAEGPVSLDLTLEPATAALPINEKELFGDGARSPFHGYRMPRMGVRGSLAIGETTHKVAGSAWLEHAWGDIPLPVGQVVWNRFTLQLRDGTDVAMLQLRRRDGSRPPLVSLLLVAGTGETQALADSELSLETIDEWISPVDGTAYPSQWRLRVPSAEMVLDIRPAVSDQEVLGALRHWSGQVEATGRRNGQPIDGWGYAELFGYAASDGGAG